jgi:hypothetical protein
MFNSSFSLRQNIKAVDTELGEYKVSNDSRVDILETFKDSLEGSAEGSIADLQAQHEAQAVLITTLETNADALKARIDTFNNALGEDAEDGVVSVIEQIKLNKDGLASEIVDRTSEITRVEGLISAEVLERLVQNDLQTSNLTAETTARTAAIAAEKVERQAELALQVTAVGAAIQQEGVERIAGDLTEATNRQTAIEKLGYIVVGEAEGVLTANSYPFSFGFGNQSEPNYGVPIPFVYTLRAISVSCITTDTNPSFTIKFLHYTGSDSIPTVLSPSLSVVGKKFSYYMDVSSPNPGDLVALVEAASGMTDDNAKFRVSMVFTVNSSIYI